MSSEFADRRQVDLESWSKLGTCQLSAKDKLSVGSTQFIVGHSNWGRLITEADEMADLTTAEAALREIGVFALGSATSKSVGDQILLDRHCRFGRSIASLEVFTEQAHNSVRACSHHRDRALQ